MDLCILCKDLDLMNLLEKKTDLNIKVLDELKLNSKDAFIVSDREVSFNKLLSSAEQEIKHNIIYILSDHYELTEIKNIISIAKNKNIKVIPPNLTKSQIANKIIKKINPDFISMKRIVAFFGGDSKVGTTMISQCIAEKFSKNNKNFKIGLLFLNDCRGTYYIDNKVSTGLDNIRAKLSNGILSKTDILDICYCPLENLYIIPGPQNIFNLRYYYPEDIEIFIEKLSNMFDLLFIDSGCKFDSGLSVAALNSTVHKILVTTQQSNSIRNFEKYSNQIFDLLDINIKEFTLIVNKYIKSPFLFTQAELSEIYRMLCLGTIPYIGMLGWKAEANNKSLNYFKNDLFNTKLNEICMILADKLNITYSLYQAKNSFIKRFKNSIKKEVSF